MVGYNFFVKSNQYLPNGYGKPAATYYYIVNEAGEIYHHKDNKFRKKELKDITTYWYKDLALATNERARLISLAGARTMYFKDEGGFYITKLTANNEPAEPNKMYEFGTLTEVPIPNKKVAKQYAKQFGRIAVFG